jgi:hypothetical protein
VARRFVSGAEPKSKACPKRREKVMNPKILAAIASVASVGITAWAQPPPNPPNPPSPPVPPGPPGRHEDRPEKKVPVTFLGVETSEVPAVVSEQLGLPKGFGLVVDYVVPDGPAAAAGVRQNDILKMLNDQVLTDPEQLAKLVRSFSEGTNISLTLVRKGKEEKVTAKLARKEVPESEIRPRRGRAFPFGEHDFGDLGMSGFHERLGWLKEQLGVDTSKLVRDAVTKAREEMRRAGDQIRILSSDWDTMKSTKIDLGKAQIVCADDKGELRIENVDGKKVLTAKDPKGLLLFSGPVETKEDLDKLPPGVRERFEKLQDRDLPAVISPSDSTLGARSMDNSDDDEDEPSSLDQISTDCGASALVLSL